MLSVSSMCVEGVANVRDGLGCQWRTKHSLANCRLKEGSGHLCRSQRGVKRVRNNRSEIFGRPFDTYRSQSSMLQVHRRDDVVTCWFLPLKKVGAVVVGFISLVLT
jgi:hypothetical protein